MNGEPLSWRHALGVGAVFFVISYGFLQFWNSRGNTLPQNSWIAVGVIVLMAVLMLYAGNEIRVYLKGESKRPPSAQKARNTVVAAQACILGGAVFTGWYAGAVAVQAARLETTTGPGAFAIAAVLAVACAGLVASGLLVQSWCRLPEDDEDFRRGQSGKPGKAGESGTQAPEAT